MDQKRIVVLGATGSIGRQTLELVRQHTPRLRVVGLAARSRVAELLAQAAEFGVGTICLLDGEAAAAAQTEWEGRGKVLCGAEGLCELVVGTEADLVVGAMSGVAGLEPVLTALEAGIDVALANKEPLVAAGGLVREAQARGGAALLPVDSELSAIFQCLQGQATKAVARIWLTASGGPLAGHTAEQLAAVTPEEALAHPTWRMGPKVTVDSATLMNKGFEVFETRWLFDVDFDRIEVVVHPQSIVHSLVEFVDGSLLAQLGLPDMRLPIQYALFYPERVPSDLPRLDLAAQQRLTFGPPDPGRFPCLRLAYEAGRQGLSYPVALNAADEVAVEAFLCGAIGFMDIPALIEATLERHMPSAPDSLDAVRAADEAARRQAAELAGVAA